MTASKVSFPAVKRPSKKNKPFSLDAFMRLKIFNKATLETILLIKYQECKNDIDS